MKRIKNDNTIFFDVDETLVTHKAKFGVDALEIPIHGVVDKVYPLEKHINLLKKSKNRGVTVFVWSQAGWEWASAVVKALKLEKYVSHVLTKPHIFVDDLEVTQWSNRVFIE